MDEKIWDGSFYQPDELYFSSYFSIQNRDDPHLPHPQFLSYFYQLKPLVILQIYTTTVQEIGQRVDHLVKFFRRNVLIFLLRRKIN